VTTRERKLAIVVGGVLGVFALGFIAYSFVLSPLLEKDRLIKAKTSEVAALEDDIEDILIAKKKFEGFREQSLPADVGVSRTEYGTLLEGLMRRADFAPGSFKIIMNEPDSKSAPTIAPKKAAYTKLSYEVTLKGELYHIVDFMQHFYKQPLLHSIKKMNIQRPSDNRAQGRRELDVTMTVEALVLDNALARPTVLPVIREIALMIGPMAHLAYNLQATTSGHGSPLPPAGVLAEAPREYLSVAGKNVFFGPEPVVKEKNEWKAADDISEFVVLTSVIGWEDGKIEAAFRDKLNNDDFFVVQTPSGEIKVEKQFEVGGKKKRFAAEGALLKYGTIDGGNERTWRVRRVTRSDVILERLDDLGRAEKLKASTMTMFGGATAAFLALPEGKIYRVTSGQSLAETKSKDGGGKENRGKDGGGEKGGGKKGFVKKDGPEGPKDEGGQLGLSSPLGRFEAWTAIYAPTPSVETSAVNPGDRRR
jgi:hypothetical protein